MSDNLTIVSEARLRELLAENTALKATNSNFTEMVSTCARENALLKARVEKLRGALSQIAATGQAAMVGSACIATARKALEADKP